MKFLVISRPSGVRLIRRPLLIVKLPNLDTDILYERTIDTNLRHFEPHRSYTIHTITELARCVGCFCTSSGWFKHSEPHRTYTILTITELARCVGYCCTRAGWFKHFEPLRTYTNHTITELARCVGCLCTSSGGSSTANLHKPHHHS